MFFVIYCMLYYESKFATTCRATMMSTIVLLYYLWLINYDTMMMM